MTCSKPPITKYLDPSSDLKTIDLVNVCRRLIADWPYHEFVNFVEVTTSPPGTINPKALKLIQERLVERTLPMMGLDGFDTGLIPYYLRDVRVTLVCGESQRTSLLEDRVTAKKFKGREGCLTSEEAIDLFWRLRMRLMSIPICPIIRQLLVEEFKKLKYDGFLLHNGKVVPFNSMHLVHFTFAPKEVTVMDFAAVQPMIEDFLRFDANDGFLCFHIALAFHLPDKDAEGKLGKVMIIDPTCAQFGMKGERGELVYSGYLEDYLKRFPAKKISVTQYMSKDLGEPGLEYFLYGDLLKETALLSLNSDFCGYCGEVERNENPEIKLKKCSKCMKASFCDALCQKMAWKSHKLVCKQGN